MSKARLAATCSALGVTWCDDASNSNLLFDRVRVRKVRCITFCVTLVLVVAVAVAVAAPPAPADPVAPVAPATATAAAAWGRRCAACQAVEAMDAAGVSIARTQLLISHIQRAARMLEMAGDTALLLCRHLANDVLTRHRDCVRAQ
jgi:hypothetical protein